MPINQGEALVLFTVEQYIEALTELFMLGNDAIEGKLQDSEQDFLYDVHEGIDKDLDVKQLATVVGYIYELDAIVEEQREKINVFKNEVAEAENNAYHIPLYISVKSQYDASQLETPTLDHLMKYKPNFMVSRLARLNNKFFRKKHLIVDRCREFLGMKRSAEELAKKELVDLDNFTDDFTARILNIHTEIYQRILTERIPPKILRHLVDSISSREIHGADDFVPALKEPLNVTVGTVHCRYTFRRRDAQEFLAKKYDFICEEEGFHFPFSIGIDEKLALCFQYASDSMESVQKNIQQICMSIFLAMPPNKIRFCFIDSLRMGHSFAVFNNFEDNNTSNINVIMGGKTLTEKDEIERHLKILVGNINTMLSVTFRGEYQNIREYNDANPLAPQPYHIIGIMDFPAGFTQESLELLERIVTEGRRCGIFVIIMINMSQFGSISRNLQDKITNIQSKCQCFQYKQGEGYFTDDDERIIYNISSPLATPDVQRIAPIMKQAIKAAEKITINYDVIAPNRAEYLCSTSDEGISIPIGLSSSRDILSLDLGRVRSQSIHALICGQIGSGKSKLLHAIITGALLKYPKEELEIYLIDFKSGTEFKIYADYNLPSLKVVALESEPEFGLSVLRALSEEKERRAQAFNAKSVEDLPSYNRTFDARDDERFPRVLIVIDEFHVLFNGSDSIIRSEAVMLLDDILRLDRNVGFHVILCSQSIRGMNALNEAALAQVAVRIALKCPIDDAKIVLGNEAGAIEQIEENDAGSAIYVPAISSQRSVKFRVGLLRREKQAEILQELDKQYRSKSIIADTRILASNVNDNRRSVFQKYFADGEITAQDRIIHVGEPMRVNATLEVRFNYGLSNNLLLLGKNSQKAQNMLFFATLDLILQKLNKLRNGQASGKIYVVNYCDGSDMFFNDVLKKLCLGVPSLVNYFDAANAHDGINKVYERSMQNVLGMPDNWLIMSNMILSPELQGGSIYGSHRETANRFKQILHDGPERGVFTLAWCDDPVLFRAKFNDTYEDFGKRIVFNISNEDALVLANVVNDGSINKNNAYLYQAGSVTEKFRPYAVPTDKWISAIVSQLNMESANDQSRD